MEVHLSAGCRMSSRIAGGDDGVQDTTGALGQGTDSSIQENSPEGACKRRASRGEDRSVLPPDREPQLSADDYPIGFADARHDHSLLSGMVSDALHRPAAVHGLDVLHLKLLPGFAKGIVSQEMATIPAVSAAADGIGNWADNYEYASRA